MLKPGPFAPPLNGCTLSIERVKPFEVVPVLLMPLLPTHQLIGREKQSWQPMAPKPTRGQQLLLLAHQLISTHQPMLLLPANQLTDVEKWQQQPKDRPQMLSEVDVAGLATGQSPPRGLRKAPGGMKPCLSCLFMYASIVPKRTCVFHATNLAVQSNTVTPLQNQNAIFP